MSRPIDEKLVKIGLDNSDFKQKSEDTAGIFAKLSSMFTKADSLTINGPVKSLGEINSKASSVDLSGLISSVESIASRFTNLGIIATTALMNITNKAIDAGLATAKAFAIEPITQGYGEYELKMGSIQTIMAGSGASLETVNNKLQELNEYADKTIYSFADMTSNIGKFTNAGVNLDDSVAAIQGISNVAALSGANAGEASRAMYNFAQALSTGSVKLMDWKSIELANMGTMEFKQQLMDTAVAQGTLAKASDGTYKSITTNSLGKTSAPFTAMKGFRDELDAQWMTADVLVATLGQYSDATTDIGKRAFAAAQDVKTFSQLTGTLKEAIGSGWAQSFELLIGDFDEAKALYSGINATLSGMIQKNSDARNEMLTGFKRLGGRQAVLDGLGNSFEALVKVISTIKEAFADIFPPVAIEKIVLIAKDFENFTEKLMMSEETAGKVKTIFKGLFSVLSIGIEVAKQLWSAFKNLIPEGAGSGILDLLVKVAEIPIKFNLAIKSSDGLKNALGKLVDALKTGMQWIWDTANSVVGVFTKTEGGVSAVSSAFSKFWNFVKPILTAFKDMLKEAFGGITGQDVASVGFIAGVGALIFKLVDKIPDLKSGISGVLDSITGAFDSFSTKSSGILTQLGGTLSAFSASIKIASLVAIAVALAILVGSIKVLEDIDAASIQKGLATLAAGLAGLTTAMGVLSKMNFSGTSAIKISVTIIALSTAIYILASAVKKISSVNPEQLSEGLTIIAGLLALITLSLAALSSIKGKIQTGATAMIGMAAAIYILASAVKKLSAIESLKLKEALIALTSIFAGLAAFMLIVDGAKIGIGTAAGVVLISAAIAIIVGEVEKIAAIPTDTLIKGLAAIGAILLALAIFSQISSGGSMLTSAIGMVIIAGAIAALMGPITTFSAMPFEALVQGIGALAVVLLAMVAAMLAAEGGIAGSVAMVLMAAAILIFTPALLALSQLSLEQVGVAILALAGAFLVIGAAAMILGGVGAVPLLIFAAGLLAISAAILIAGVGISLLAAGLGALTLVAVASVTAIVAAFKAFIVGLVNLIPEIATFVITFVTTLVTGLADAIPVLAAAGMEMILGLLTAMLDNAPKIITVAVALLLELLKGLAIGLPALLDATIKLLISFINGIADGIRNNADKILKAVMNILEAILELIIEALVQIIGTLISFIPGAKDKVTELGNTAKDALKDAFGIDEVVEDKVDNANTALKDGQTTLVGTTSSIGTGASTAFGDTFNISGLAAAEAGNAERTLDAKKAVLARKGEELGTATTGGVTSTLDLGLPAGLEGNEFIASILGASPDAALAGMGLGTSTTEGVDSALDLVTPADRANKEFVDTLNGGKEEAKEAGVENGKGYVEGVDSTNTKPSGEKLLSGLLKPIKDGSPQLIETGKGATTKIKEGAESETANPSGQKIIDTYNQGATSKFPTVWSTGKLGANEMNTALGSADTNTTGATKMTSYAQGVRDKTPLGYTRAKEASSEVNRGLGAPNTYSTALSIMAPYAQGISDKTNVGYDKAKFASSEVERGLRWANLYTTAIGQVSEFGRGITSGTTSSYNKGKTVGSSANTGFKDGVGSLYSSAVSGVDGAAQGIYDRTWIVKAAARALADAANNAFRNRLEIMSPSRVMMEAGSFFGEGVAVGISSQTDNVWSAASDLANAATETVGQYAEAFSGAILDEMSLEPTVTPVLDLDKFKFDPKNLSTSVPVSFNGLNVSDKFSGVVSGFNSTASRQQPVVNQNDQSVNVDNRGLLDGATILIREEADIDKLAERIGALSTIRLRGAGYAV